MAYSPDGQWLASGSWDNTVRLWDALTGECCAKLPHRNAVHTLAFSPDSSWLVTGCTSDPQLSIWDVATAQRRRVHPAPGFELRALAVSPDGARIAALDANGKLSLREAATGKETASIALSGIPHKRSAVAFSPDGRRLAVISEKQAIHFWDTQTQQLSAPLTGHTKEIYSVAFSADGRRLVSASQDRTVRVWDVDTGACEIVLSGDTDEVFTAVFHPGGTRIASAGLDGTIWLWDPATGEEVARLKGHTNYVFSLTFSPDGKTLASSSGDGTVRLWDTKPVARRHQARRQAEALRPEAERLVERLFREHREPAGVVAALRADGTLSEPLRRAALRVVMGRAGDSVVR